MERLRAWAWAAWRRLRRDLFGKPYPVTVYSTRLPTSEAEELGRHASGDFARMFYAHRGRSTDKWTHYMDIYDRHLSLWRGHAVRFLEIGVWKGGSLELWREYLGQQATIFGIDIDPTCAGKVDPPNQFRLGSQADAAFLRQVVEEMGGLDVVIDDGSHIAPHQRASFRALWPVLSDGGLYVIEDMHTAYWPGVYRGGFRRNGTAVEIVKGLTDDLNRAYHWHGQVQDVAALHLYDSVAVIEKRARSLPT